MFSEILGTEGIILPEARKRIENFPLGNAILEIYYSYNADIRRCVLFDQFNIRDTKLERRKDLVDSISSRIFFWRGTPFLFFEEEGKEIFTSGFFLSAIHRVGKIINFSSRYAWGKIRRYCWIPSTPAIISRPETTSIPEEIRSRPATTRKKSIRRHGDTDWPPRATRASKEDPRPEIVSLLLLDSSSSRSISPLDITAIGSVNRDTVFDLG